MEKNKLALQSLSVPKTIVSVAFPPVTYKWTVPD